MFTSSITISFVSSCGGVAVAVHVLLLRLVIISFLLFTFTKSWIFRVVYTVRRPVVNCMVMVFSILLSHSIRRYHNTTPYSGVYFSYSNKVFWMITATIVASGLNRASHSLEAVHHSACFFLFLTLVSVSYHSMLHTHIFFTH